MPQDQFCLITLRPASHFRWAPQDQFHLITTFRLASHFRWAPQDQFYLIILRPASHFRWVPQDQFHLITTLRPASHFRWVPQEHNLIYVFHVFNTIFTQKHFKASFSLEVSSTWPKHDLWYFIFKLNTKLNGWLVGCFGLKGPLRQYFSLYRAVSQRERKRKVKW